MICSETESKMATGTITCKGKGGWGAAAQSLGGGYLVAQALGDSAMLWPPAASAPPSAALQVQEACFLTQFSSQSLFSCSLVMLLACQSDTAACSAAHYNKFTVPSKFSGKVLCQAA